MPKTGSTTNSQNIVQLPMVRRPALPPVSKVTRPPALAAVPFEAWITVRDRAAAALLGGTRYVLITGAAGTGKTVMLEDVARVLRAAGRTVLVRQADTEPSPPGRGETLFVDEADRLTPTKLRDLLDNSEGTVVLAGLGSLAQKTGAQRAGGKVMHLTLAPLGQEAARDYVVQWLASTGRVPAHLDSAGLRQVVEASGGVPRLLSTLLGGGAWLAETSGAATITAEHIREAAELRSVMLPAVSSAATVEVPRRGRVMVPAILAGALLVGAGIVVAARVYPTESAELVRWADGYGGRARDWLGGVSGKRANTAAPATISQAAAPPVARVDVPPGGRAALPQNSQAALPASSQAALPANSQAALPPISQHVVPRPEVAVVEGADVLAAAAVPALIEGALPGVTVTLPETDPAALPIETQAFLLRRGRQMAAVEDVSAARLLFRRAAEGGSAEAAYALGRTYDPAVATGLSASQADLAEAIRWYRRAAAAGDAAAKAALAGR